MRTTIHITLHVRDLLRSMRFYSELFRRKPDTVTDSFFQYELEKPALVIAFVQAPEEVKIRFGNLGLRVDDYNAFRTEKIRARTLGWLEEEEINGYGGSAAADKFYFHDPDGYRWIYYYDTDYGEECNTEQSENLERGIKLPGAKNFKFD